jgi:hypothetical protein
MRCSNAGDCIGGTRAGGHQTNPWFARGPSITICSMGCPLLVAHKDMANIILLVQSIIYMEYCPTRIAKDVLNALVLQKLDDDIRAV